jgi:hypothetical protein
MCNHFLVILCENYGELVSNTEEQLRIVSMYTGNLFYLHDLAIWKWLKKMCTFEVHLCMMYGQLILSGKPFSTFSIARLKYCNCVWPSLPFPIPPRILLYKSLLPRMACIFFSLSLSPFFPHDLWLEWGKKKLFSWPFIYVSYYWFTVICEILKNG